MDLYGMLTKVPGIRELLHKLALMDDATRKLEYENLLLAQENIDARLMRKKQRGEKIHVVFVCHRPALWESLRGVYDTLKADPDFTVTIVAIPQKNRKKGVEYRHEEYTGEGAEAFFQGEGCVNGYDYATGQWLDLRTLKPDYVFFQQPYNVARPEIYSSGVVSKYAKICSVSYFAIITLDDTCVECTPTDFLKDLSFFFAQHEADREFVLGRMKEAGPNVASVITTGFPRFEKIREHAKEKCDIWNDPSTFKILWTPRWTTNEGNCHFFSFKERFVAYCQEHPDTELTFRPHPQAFKEWLSTGELTQEGQDKVRQVFSQGNLHLDESMNYYPMMFSSDVLITDRSTMFVDYLFTGKPIIYCANHGVHDEVIGGVENGMYWVNSWEELIKVLEDIKRGVDPLKETRAQIADAYQGRSGQKASERIRDILKADAMKE